MENIIEVKKTDVIPYVYFVCCLAQNTSNSMHGALSSKGDLIGGIFDRWINIIPESIVFNKYILPKAKEEAGANECDVKVVSDFYIYDPKEVGIAPDVIGIKVDKKVIPFVKYDDSDYKANDENNKANDENKVNCWKRQGESPLIEMKSFMGRKYMVSLRNQGYDNKYLVLVNTHMPVDYLLPFFDRSIFDNITIGDMYEDTMLENNDKGMLNKAESVNFSKDTLGNIEILRVTKAEDFMNLAMLLNKGDIPRYFKEVEKRTKKMLEGNSISVHSLSYYCDQQGVSNRYRFNESWVKEIFTGEKTLDITIDGTVSADKILVIGKTRDDIIVKLDDGISGYAMINNCDIKIEGNNLYNIKFGKFGAIRGEEYFMNKSLVSCLPDSEGELVEILSDIIKRNK